MKAVATENTVARKEEEPGSVSDDGKKERREQRWSG